MRGEQKELKLLIDAEGRAPFGSHPPHQPQNLWPELGLTSATPPVLRRRSAFLLRTPKTARWSRAILTVPGDSS